MDREEKERVCVYGSRESSASVCGCECGGKFVFVQGIEGNNILGDKHQCRDEECFCRTSSHE